MAEDQFKQDLIKDVVQAQSGLEKEAASRGVAPSAGFAPRALMIQKKAVGQREIAKLEQTLNTSIDDLLFESGLTNKTEQEKFRSKLRGQVQSLQMYLLKQAGEIKKAAAARGLDQQKTQALWSALGNIGKGVTTAYVAGIGKSSPDTPVAGGPGIAESLQQPQIGQSFAAQQKQIAPGPSLMPKTPQAQPWSLTQGKLKY